MDIKKKRVTRKITRETCETNCPKCGNKITGTSEKTLKNNLKIHLAFCGRKK
ncbi:MAG: hypothetical protein PHE43_04740 [Candidatus Nanoarchaeia archaeon]|nr:hypothetical protein [Candidatus Nanoarchaeia archaeon]